MAIGAGPTAAGKVARRCLLVSGYQHLQQSRADFFGVVVRRSATVLWLKAEAPVMSKNRRRKASRKERVAKFMAGRTQEIYSPSRGSKDTTSPRRHDPFQATDAFLQRTMGKDWN